MPASQTCSSPKSQIMWRFFFDKRAFLFLLLPADWYLRRAVSIERIPGVGATNGSIGSVAFILHIALDGVPVCRYTNSRIAASQPRRSGVSSQYGWRSLGAS